MMIAKVIPNGGSQAVRLPKSCRFESDEVNVNKIGDVVFLTSRDSDRAKRIVMALSMFTEDFMTQVDDPKIVP